MAVYYKFKSAKNYDSINIDGHFISVANLKERIFESKHLGRGTDFDLMISNAQTDEEYADEAMLIPKNTSVMVRRVPGRPRKNIVTQPDEPKVVEDQVEDVPQPKISISAADSSAMRFPEESEWDEFGNDLYAIPEMLPVQSSNPVVNIPPPNKVDEESKIKALVDTPALDWNRQVQETYGPGRGYGRGMGGRMMGGRGFGRGGMERGMERGMMERGLERKNPPAGYICHRCKVPGHFIQHCPTNGDPNYDIRRVKPPTGIPKSMLMATPDGSYALPSGAVAVLKPNEAAFEKEIEGMPSTRSVTDLPPELRCPLCKDVMKDAVLTSKCCFSSFCDKCIRDHIISKSMCVCGATNILADDLLPNKTLRETINRIMESTTSSTENVGSLLQAQDMESAHPGQPKAQSPTLSATTATKEVHTIPCIELAPNIKEGGSENRVDVAAVDVQSLEKKADKNVELSVATPESTSAKEPMSQGSAPVPEEDVQEKLLLNDQGKRKKKKKIRVPGNAGDMQWRGYQDLGAESYAGMPFLPSAYNNPYFAGMPWGMDGFAAPFPGAMPMMGYAPGPFDVPFGGVLPQQDPFGGQGYMMPVPPHRDLAELSMGGMSTNLGPPIMSREEFEAKKADMRRRREMDRRERESSSRDNREREMTRNVGNSAEISSLKSKPPKLVSRASKSTERPAGRGKSPEQQRPSGLARDTTAAHHRHVSPPRAATKRKSAHPDETGSAADTAKGSTADRKHKGSVFSRISFPGSGSDGGGGGGSKKRKSGSEVANGIKEDREHGHRVSSSKSNGYRDDWRPPATTTDKGGSGIGSRRGEPHDREYSSEEEEEEEEYHFKRRPSSRHHEAAVEWEEGGGGGEVDEGRSSHKGSRERERARDHHDHHDRAVKRR